MYDLDIDSDLQKYLPPEQVTTFDRENFMVPIRNKDKGALCTDIVWPVSD